MLSQREVLYINDGAMWQSAIFPPFLIVEERFGSHFQLGSTVQKLDDVRLEKHYFNFHIQNIAPILLQNGGC